MQFSVADVLAWMSDCIAANLASYRDSLKGPFPYSDHNGCLPHTGLAHGMCTCAHAHAHALARAHTHTICTRTRTRRTRLQP